MAKQKAPKTPPVTIKITGSQQAANIQNAFVSKETAKLATEAYDAARNIASPLILSKVYGHWTKIKSLHTGSYALHLPDGSVRTVTVQNRQSTKVYEPTDAKTVIDNLNATTDEDAPLRMADIYQVKTKHVLSEDAMQTPKVRDRVVEVLTALEAELKADRTLAPEIALITEDKKLLLAKHAITRIIALSNDIDKAIGIIDDPVTVSLID